MDTDGRAEEPVLDPEVEEARLDELGKRIEDTAERAHEDLDVGGSGRTFADEGVRSQVEVDGDTRHPPADRP